MVPTVAFAGSLPRSGQRSPPIIAAVAPGFRATCHRARRAGVAGLDGASQLTVRTPERETAQEHIPSVSAIRGDAVPDPTLSWYLMCSLQVLAPVTRRAPVLGHQGPYEAGPVRHTPSSSVFP